MQDTNLTLLFQKYLAENTTIQLENKDRIPVGALYLTGDSIEDLVICNTNTTEKYYIYVPCSFGKVAIFFTYWRKL